jgi:hypothetical protein
MKRGVAVLSFVALGVPAPAAGSGGDPRTPAEGARGDEVDRCVAASEHGQDARRRHALRRARAEFIECSTETCPSVVRSACATWVDEVDAILPTVVVAVSHGGKDVTSARIDVDGHLVSQGEAVPIDAGRHEIHVRSEGYKDAEAAFIAREGEKNRIIPITMDAKDPAPASSAPETSSNAVRPITWITGGLAVVALGSFAYFGISGRSRAQDLRSTCAPFCSAADRDGVRTTYLIADISLIAAVVLGGVGVWTLVSTPPGTEHLPSHPQ